MCVSLCYNVLEKKKKKLEKKEEVSCLFRCSHQVGGGCSSKKWGNWNVEWEKKKKQTLADEKRQKMRCRQIEREHADHNQRDQMVKKLLLLGAGESGFACLCVVF